MTQSTPQTGLLPSAGNVDAAQADVDEIYLGNLGTVDADLTFPARGHRGSKFSWTSNDHLYLTDEGHVTRPLPGVGNRQIVVTVQACNGDDTANRSFAVTVIEQEQTARIESVDDVLVDTMEGMPLRLPTVAIARRADGSVGTIPAMWQIDVDTTTADGPVHTVHGTGLDADQEFRIEAHVTAHDIDVRAQALDAARLARLQTQSLQARLHDGTDFADVAHDVGGYLLEVDDDHMLVNFRTAAGLDTHGAPLMTGWDAPDSKLRGHTTGHYLSALALAFRATGDERFSAKIGYLVDGLGQCQDALHAERGCARGFLAAYDEEPFALLEQGAHYPDVWAPYYTQDKILSGLLDACEFGCNNDALRIAVNMGLWISQRLGHLSPEHRARMWSTYIAGEFGGLRSTLVRLYQISGNPAFVRTATYFDNDKLLYPMVRNVDTLAGMHANQHIPQITGALDLFTYAADAGKGGIPPSYSTSLEAARNFWRMITEHHVFAQGGVGETEMIRDSDAEAANLSDKSAENCASYSMMKLTAALFGTDPNARYANYYDHVLRNHILATFSRHHDGGATYFFPLRAGGQCAFDTAENTCCHGSGLENPFRYQNMIATEQEAGHDVSINLYIPAELSGEVADLDLLGESDFDDPERAGFRIISKTSGTFKLRIRVPDYAEDVKLEIVPADGNLESPQPLYIALDEGGYAHVERAWAAGDAVLISWIPGFRVHRCPDRPQLASLSYGGDVLVALTDEPEPLHVDPQVVAMELRSHPCEWRERLGIEVAGTTWVPIYRNGGRRFAAYVDIG